MFDLSDLFDSLFVCLPVVVALGDHFLLALLCFDAGPSLDLRLASRFASRFLLPSVEMRLPFSAGSPAEAELPTGFRNASPAIQEISLRRNGKSRGGLKLANDLVQFQAWSQPSALR